LKLEFFSEGIFGRNVENHESRFAKNIPTIDNDNLPIRSVPLNLIAKILDCKLILFKDLLIGDV
jgi:hypothetical protein